MPTKEEIGAEFAALMEKTTAFVVVPVDDVAAGETVAHPEPSAFFSLVYRAVLKCLDKDGNPIGYAVAFLNPQVEGVNPAAVDVSIEKPG